MVAQHDPAFLREVWGLFVVGVAIIFLRIAVRIKTVGIKGFQGDDWFTFVTLGMYTCDAATVHIVYYAGTNVEASVAQAGGQVLTDHEIESFRYGSQVQLVAWYSYTALIWSMKATMLFFFARLTIGLWQHKFVKYLAWICGLSYLAVFLTLTFGCFPTQKNWQVVPDPGLKCTLKLQNFLVAVVLNVITDALILAIPVPLLWTLRIPVRRKIVIGLLLCSGMFVIAAAIIRVVLTLDNNPSALNINRWGVRETIVGIITINLPILRPLFSKKFWSRDSFKSSTLSYGESRNIQDLKNGSGRGNTVSGMYELESNPKSQNVRAWGRDVEKGSGLHRKGGSSSEASLGRRDSMDGGSQEHIIIQNNGQAKDGVMVQTTFVVEHESAEASSSDDRRNGNTSRIR